MQAYASAQLTPPESASQQAPVPSIKPASGAAVNGAAVAQPDTASPVMALVSAIVDGLSDRDLGVLARRLLPHLRQPTDLNDGHPAYTVASLAAELGVSQKTIRSAIARRELTAVKRGARWLISAEAVREWATPSEARPRPRRTRGAAVPKAAGPSLRAVLCTGAGQGGRR
jgi:excisionase family DNA binding protein